MVSILNDEKEGLLSVPSMGISSDRGPMNEWKKVFDCQKHLAIYGVMHRRKWDWTEWATQDQAQVEGF